MGVEQLIRNTVALTITLTLACAFSSTETLAAPPAWLRLLQPEKGRFAVATGIRQQHDATNYPEQWLRTERESVERLISFGLWHRLGDRQPDKETALVFNLAITTQSTLEMISALGPEGIHTTRYQAPHRPGANLLLAWQKERITPLWRYGAQLGASYAIHADQTTYQASLWTARIYEPVVLQASLGRDFWRQGSATHLRLGLTMAVSPKISLSAALQEAWPHPTAKNRGHLDPVQLTAEVAVNVRYLDQSGWKTIVRMGKEGHGISIERSVAIN